MSQNYGTGTLVASAVFPCWTRRALSDISLADLGSIHFSCRSLILCEF